MTDNYAVDRLSAYQRPITRALTDLSRDFWSLEVPRYFEAGATSSRRKRTKYELAKRRVGLPQAIVGRVGRNNPTHLPSIDPPQQPLKFGPYSPWPWPRRNSHLCAKTRDFQASCGSFAQPLSALALFEFAQKSGRGRRHHMTRINFPPAR